MKHITVNRRLSHIYTDGWRHLDRYKPVARLKGLSLRVCSDGNRYDDHGITMQVWVSPKPVLNKRDRNEIARALADTLSGSNCRHEYDCCGCISRSARVVFSKGRSFHVRTRLTANY